ncbi:hypothetical protein [Streptomyces sp. NPDC002516]
MAFEFPAFRDPVVINEDWSWTAVFESYDQRTDDVYYWASLHRAGQRMVSFMVQGDMLRFGDDWRGSWVTYDLERQIHQVVVTGRSNTNYRGTARP